MASKKRKRQRPKSPPNPPRRARRRVSRRRTWWAPVTLIAAAVLWAALSSFGVGLSWDESIHIGYVSNYHGWFASVRRSGFGGQFFTAPVLHAVWQSGQAHPPLGKIAMLAAFEVFDGFVPSYIALRLASVCWFAVALTALYHLVRLGGNRRAALCATAVLALLPRFMGHSHIAAYDMPVAALWTVTALFAWLSLKRHRYAAALGVSLGLALLTKINGFFIPFALIPWLVFFGRRKALWPLLAIGLLAPLVFVVGWPALWHDPMLGFLRYAVDKLGYSSLMFNPFFLQAHPGAWLLRFCSELVSPSGRSVISVYYLGRVWSDPPAPWHYPLVLLIVTTPLLFLLGLGSLVRSHAHALVRRPFFWLLALNLFVAILPFLRPSTPKYDGVRLFLPAVPFLAAFCGIGLASSWDRIRRHGRLRPVQNRRLALLVFWSFHVLVLAWLHPFYLSFYGGAAGGVYGAHKLGFETTYWGDTATPTCLAAASRHMRRGDIVMIVPTGLAVPPQLQYYGMLPEWVQPTAQPDRTDWDVLILIPRQGLFRSWMWDLYLDRTPVWEQRLMGVPQVQVYVRRRR